MALEPEDLVTLGVLKVLPPMTFTKPGLCNGELAVMTSMGSQFFIVYDQSQIPSDNVVVTRLLAA